MSHPLNSPICFICVKQKHYDNIYQFICRYCGKANKIYEFQQHTILLYENLFETTHFRGIHFCEINEFIFDELLNINYYICNLYGLILNKKNFFFENFVLDEI